MILVVGATGLLGSEICRLLAASGQPFRALTRVASDTKKTEQIRALGSVIVHGDLKDPATLATACHGVDTVISTASSTFSRQPGDAIATVDHEGQLSLVAAAVAAGVRRFIFVSFPPSDVVYPLQSAKRAVEDRIRRSGMIYTILQPTFFFEIWWGPGLGFDAANGTAQIYGTGRNKMTPISYPDVARFAVASLGNAAARNATILLGGPDRISPLEIVALYEQTLGRKFTVKHTKESALRTQWQTATDPMQKSFAGLMVDFANACPIEMGMVLKLFPLPLRSIRTLIGSR